MQNLTDEELAGRFQAGETGAANEVVDRYWRQAKLIALEYPINGIDVDDRHMEAIQGLLKAAGRWLPGKGTKFKTYAKRVMRCAMIDLWRDRNQKRQVPPDMKLSLDVQVSDEEDAGTLGDEIADPLDLFDEVERRVYAQAAASNVLKAHKEVLFGVAQGYELGEIAAYLGVAAEYVLGVMRFNRAVGAVFAARNVVPG